MRYFCKKLNIEQRFTTAYNPASNGETERFNRTIPGENSLCICMYYYM
jgi:transposase InsO family protein